MDTENTPEKPTSESPKQETVQVEQSESQPGPETVHIKHAHKLVYGYLLLLVLAAFVGLGGYLYKGHHHAKPVAAQQSSTGKPKQQQIVTDPYVGWNSSTLNYEQYGFKYPTDWHIDNTFKPDGVTGSVSPGSDEATLYSPDNMRVTINSGVTGTGDGFGKVLASQPIKTLGGNYYLDFYTNDTSNPSEAQGACVGTSASGGASYPFSQSIQLQTNTSGKPFDVICVSFYDQSGTVVEKPVSVLKSDSSFADARLIIQSLIPASKADPYSGWRTYANQQAGLTFKYPASWKSQTTTDAAYSDGSFAGVSGVLTSPAGHKLTWVYQVAGGKGDAGCTPSQGDVSFASGNKCASKQILDVEQIPSVKATTRTLRNLFEDNLYITETKFATDSSGIDPVTGTHQGGVTYQICLDPQYNRADDPYSTPPKVGGATMGFELPCEYWDTGFNAAFHANSEADLSSSDAQTAKLIMRSFNSLQ